MQFQVPQFIEIEDKVFGPFSFKQFIYIVGSIGVAFIFYVYLPLFVAIVPMTLVVSLGFSLAFYKINNRPFVFMLQSMLKYYINRKLYLWKKSPTVTQQTASTISETSATPVPILTKSRLEDLAWSLDVKDKLD
jgi:hypothetical protein